MLITVLLESRAARRSVVNTETFHHCFCRYQGVPSGINLPVRKQSVWKAMYLLKNEVSVFVFGRSSLLLLLPIFLFCFISPVGWQRSILLVGLKPSFVRKAFILITTTDWKTSRGGVSTFSAKTKLLTGAGLMDPLI